MLSRFSHVQLFATPWTVACQAPLSKEFSRKEYWNGLPFPSPGDLSNPGIEPMSLMSPHWQVGSLPLAPPGKPQMRMLLLLLSHFSRVRLCATPWTAAHQAPPSMGFSRQEYWSGAHGPYLINAQNACACQAWCLAYCRCSIDVSSPPPGCSL